MTIFHPDCIRVYESLSPVFAGLDRTGFAEMAYANLFELLGVFLNVVLTSSIFPTKKMYLICSKEFF